MTRTQAGGDQHDGRQRASVGAAGRCRRRGRARGRARRQALGVRRGHAGRDRGRQAGQGRVIRNVAAEALPGDHVDAGEDEDGDRIAEAEDGPGDGRDAEDAEAEHRQTEGDQPAGDAADEEDHQQPEHLASRPTPAHGDRFAHPHALDDDERADERQPSSHVRHRDERDQRHQHDDRDESRRLLGSADEDEGDRDADDEGRHDHDDQDDGADHEVGQDVVQQAPEGLSIAAAKRRRPVRSDGASGGQKGRAGDDGQELHDRREPALAQDRDGRPDRHEPDHADEQQWPEAPADIVHGCAQRGLDRKGMAGRDQPATLARERSPSYPGPTSVRRPCQAVRRRRAERRRSVGSVIATPSRQQAHRASASKKVEPIAIPDDFRRPRPAVVAAGHRRSVRAGPADGDQVTPAERWQRRRAECIGRLADRSVDLDSRQRARNRRPAARGWSAPRSGGGPRRGPAG